MPEMTELEAKLTPIDAEFSTDTVNPMSAERKDNTVLLAAAATSDRPENFPEQRRLHKATLDHTTEDDLRLSMSDLHNERDQAAMAEAVADMIFNPDRDAQEQAIIESFQTTREILQERETYDALEIEGIRKIIDFSLEHPEYVNAAALMAEDLARGDASDWISDQLERSSIIAREAARIQEEHQESSLIDTIVNYAATIIPLNKLTASDDIPGASFWNLSGSNVKGASETLMNMPRSEFNRVYPEVFKTIREQSGFLGENPLIAQELIKGLQGMSEQDAANSNIFDAVDIASVIPVFTGVKLAKAAFLKAASRPAAVDAVEATLRGSDEAVLATDDALEATMPSGMKLPDGVNSPSVGEAVARKLEVQKEVIERLRSATLGGAPDVPRLTPEELLAAVDATKEEVLSRFGKAATVDFYTEQSVRAGIPFKNGIAKLGYIVGRKDGHGFASEGTAQAAIKRNGIGDGEIVYDQHSGTYFIRGKMDVAEKNFATMKHTDVTEGTVMGSFLRSSASILPEYMQRRAVAADFSQSAMHRLMQPIVKDLGSLNRKQREGVNAVIVRGRDVDNKWYNLTEFHREFRQLNGRAPVDKEVQGYYSLKNLNDFEYYMRNHAEYIKSATEGWQTGKLEHVNFSMSTRNVRKVEQVPDLRGTTLFDVDAGVFRLGSDLVPADIQQKITKGGYDLFKVQDAKLTAKGGKPVKYVLAKAGQMQLEPLQYQQLLYRPGGHRIYRGTVFAKQAIVGSITSAGGRVMRYIHNPKTHAVFTTKGEADTWVARMEEARDAFVRHEAGTLGRNEADEILKRAGFEDGVDEFQEHVTKGRIVKDQKFETIRDGENPSVYKSILDENGNLDLREVSDSRPSWMEDHGRLYYSKRGAALAGPQDELAETIDPFRAANRAVENAMQTSSYINYKVNAVQRWMKEFGHTLPKNEGVSDLQRFWSAGALQGDPTLIRAGERSRRALMNQLGHPTKAGRDWQESMVSFADFVEKKVPGKPGSNMARGILDLQSRDPVASLKGLTFDAKLGLFDPSQLIVQTQTAAAMMSIDPLNAPRFFRDAFPMRWAAINIDDNILAAAAKMSSMDADEFKAMVKTMRKSGAADPNGELVLLDKHPGISASYMGQKLDNFRQKGRIFFYEAERLNRIYGWRKAWNDLRNEGATVEHLSTPEGRAQLSSLTDKYTINMVSASAASWQKGAWSVPTQFLSYQARFIENILPKGLGGNPQWTSGQKLALVSGQLFLYGSAGIPAGRAIAEYAKDKLGLEFEGDNFADNVAHRAILGGAIDSMIYASTLGEVDVAFGARAAIIGKGLSDLGSRLMGTDVGNSSFLEVVAGAPFGVLGDIGSDTANSMAEMYRVAASGTASVTDILPEMLSDIGDNLSVLSRAQRAYHVIKYGEWISQESGKAITSATPMEAFAAALGIQPRDIAEIDWMRHQIDEDKTFTKDMAKRVRQLQLEALRARGQGDVDTYNRKLRIVVALTQHLPSPQRMKIHVAGSRLPNHATVVEEMKAMVLRTLGIDAALSGASENTNRREQ